MPPVLVVENLTLAFHPPHGRLVAVDGVSFEIERGQTLALVGESGCGKSLTALALLRLHPADARIESGRVLLDGDDLVQRTEAGLRGVRGHRAAMIFQEPMTSLNPLLTIGRQIDEVQVLHRRVSPRQARRRTIELLERVGIPQPSERADAHPHELSGGMRQRVMIAMALACDPGLLIADEPTTALDVTVQAQILLLLADLQREHGMAMLFITHDLGAVRQIARDTCVMYSGRVVERGPTADVLSAPQHPYTEALLACLPVLDAPITGGDARVRAGAALGPGGGGRLPTIAGEAPTLATRPRGCAFHPRCPHGRDEPQCRTQTPPLEAPAADRLVACWKRRAP